MGRLGLGIEAPGIPARDFGLAKRHRRGSWSGRAVHLNSFSVSGFRSLTELADIPLRKPTILAGHNDGGLLCRAQEDAGRSSIPVSRFDLHASKCR